jgi:hypothetical protein
MEISKKTNRRRHDKLFKNARKGEKGKRKERKQKEPEITRMHLSVNNNE